eukprot:CAMPEP_0182918452 /NCGR_PEP_ID=MMETSP0105_2-20130417/2104_1 /TAXON_ID=81532 ORGANISM="Acanthoeca-like sp., Strain 10tr" /NCGR_SAMPLE_ID=MMETSP0105_2 /ASSEMBLY_ACC=CAM_ASM_000205 /LENGTH=57 /DNA_ID=CAMNT_0025055543 /DNA_START=88 /DNA_END=259 /DNA_ORIENTATION=+
MPFGLLLARQTRQTINGAADMDGWGRTALTTHRCHVHLDLRNAGASMVLHDMDGWGR